MKLRIIGFETEIEIKENQVTVLEIENAELFTNVLEKINNKINRDRRK